MGLSPFKQNIGIWCSTLERANFTFHVIRRLLDKEIIHKIIYTNNEMQFQLKDGSLIDILLLKDNRRGKRFTMSFVDIEIFNDDKGHEFFTNVIKHCSVFTKSTFVYELNPSSEELLIESLLMKRKVDRSFLTVPARDNC